MIEYKLKKLITIILCALIPIFSSTFLILVGVNVLFVLLYCFFIALVVGFIGNIVTSQNPWVQAIEGRNMLCFDINSSGIVKLFSVIIQVPDIKLKTNKGSEMRIYDRMISFVLKTPEGKMLVKENEDEDTLVFNMPRKDFQKSLFKSGYLNFLIYNSQTGMFLTKEFLAKSEKELMIEYVTLNEWKELKELNKIMRDFTRQTMDTINNTLGGILESPIFKVVALIFVALVVGFIGIALLDLLGIDIFGTVGGMIPASPIKSISTPLPLIRGF